MFNTIWDSLITFTKSLVCYVWTGLCDFSSADWLIITLTTVLGSTLSIMDLSELNEPWRDVVILDSRYSDQVLRVIYTQCTGPRDSSEFRNSLLSLINDGHLFYDFNRLYTPQEHNHYNEVLLEVRSIKYQGLPTHYEYYYEGLDDLQKRQIFIDLLTKPVSILDLARNHK